MEDSHNRSIELCSRVVTTESIIEEAKAIYGNKYDYSKVSYINGKHKIIVGCHTHGDFEVFARDHLDGKGCPKCDKGEKFKAKIIERFGDKFDFDRFIYNGSNIPVEVTCREHGAFVRTPVSILNSSCGCPECAAINAKRIQEEQSRRAAIRRKEKEREMADLLILQSTKEANDNKHKYLSDCDISNFWQLEKLMARLDNRTLKKLIRNLQWELDQRPKTEGKSRIHYERYFVQTTDTFVSIDFETLYSQRVSACSIGMVKFVNGEIADRYYSLIRPPFDYEGKKGGVLTWVHGFTEEMLQDERTFDEILPEIESFVGELPLVAHNCCVERACIHDAAEYYGMKSSLDIDNILDTYPISYVVEEKLDSVIEGAGTHSLDAVCRRFGIEEMKHHNALDDAEMCGKLMVVFHKILNNEINIELNIPYESRQSLSKESKKINPEDRVQRADLGNVKDNPFKNKVVVLTGFAKCDSQLYAHQLNELGAIIKDAVNKKTNILITGYNAGPSKLKKAEEFGVQIIPENELQELLKSI